MPLRKFVYFGLLYPKVPWYSNRNIFVRKFTRSTCIFLKSQFPWTTMSRYQDFDEALLSEHLLKLKPREPRPEECCGDGCQTCVHDVYEQELEIWKKGCLSFLGYTFDEPEPSKKLLSQSSYAKFKLMNITPETKDSNIYRFSIPDNQSLKLKIGEHLILRSRIDDQNVCRPYTPISPLNSRGYFDLLIKTYKTGLMSNYVSQLKPGDEAEFRGPFNKFEYTPNSFKKIFLVAAGTGITPMIPLIESIVENEDDETFLRLLFACRTYDDILLRKTLDHFKSYWNVTVRYFLSQELNKREHYGEDIHYGRIDKNVLWNEISDCQTFKVLVCGTPSFNKDIKAYLFDILNDTNKYFVF